MTPRGPKPSERRHRYRAVVEELARRHAGQLEKGKVYRAEVRHDGWCAMLAGRGPCDCNPVATLIRHGD